MLQIDSIEELQKAAEDPKKFLEGLAQTMLPMAKAIAVQKATQMLSSKLPAGVSSGDIALELKSALDGIQTPEELAMLVVDSAKLLLALEGSISRAKAENALKGKIEAKVKKQALTWDDTKAILKSASVTELEAATGDPEAFFDGLVGRTSTNRKKWAICSLKVKLVPQLKAQNVQMGDMVPILEAWEDVVELEAAIVDPDAFMAKLDPAPPALAIKWAAAKYRPDIEPKVRESGLTWEDLKLVFEKVEAAKEIQDAAAMDEESLEKWITATSQKVSQKADDDAAAANRKEKQKMVWPALFQLSAVALWTSTSSVRIDPCVGYMAPPLNSVFMKFITFDNAADYFDFLLIIHWCMLGTVLLLLALIPLSGRLRLTRLQNYLPLAVAATLGAYIVLIVLKRPEIELPQIPTKAAAKLLAKALVKKLMAFVTHFSFATVLALFQWWGAHIGAAAQAVAQLPVSSFMFVGFAAEGCTRLVACKYSEPSAAEMTTYKNQRAKMIAEKAESLADAAPPSLYEKALQSQNNLAKMAAQVQAAPAKPVAKNWMEKATTVVAAQKKEQEGNIIQILKDKGVVVKDGDFRVALLWSARTDLDLYLETPKGKCYHGAKKVATFKLDIDDRGSGKAPFLENITCNGEMPNGRYKAICHNCGSGEPFWQAMAFLPNGNSKYFTGSMQKGKVKEEVLFEFEMQDGKLTLK
mmetsp:Transcript_78440/g.253665  ORF Transcript_78440/g.253665 Transcript_78440/m.253665 type:complete len:697 (-) Transcript_78440:182-2272(-)